RRRHTRLVSDWSSDVCSSDLQEGGYKAWAQRLRDPKVRARLRREMTTPQDVWENLMLAAGGDGTLLVGFKNEALRQYAGKTLGRSGERRGGEEGRGGRGVGDE